MTDFFNSVGMEYVVIGLAAALLLALILVIVALVKVGKLKTIRKVFIWERWKIVRGKYR